MSVTRSVHSNFRRPDQATGVSLWVASSQLSLGAKPQSWWKSVPAWAPPGLPGLVPRRSGKWAVAQDGPGASTPPELSGDFPSSLWTRRRWWFEGHILGSDCCHFLPLHLLALRVQRLGLFPTSPAEGHHALASRCATGILQRFLLFRGHQAPLLSL